MATSRRKGGRKAYLKKYSNGYIHAGSSVNNFAMKEYQSMAYSQRARGGFPFMLEGSDIPPIRIEQSPYWQRIHEFNHIYLIKTENQSLRLFFAGHEAFFIKTVGNAKKRSILYGSVEKAKRAARLKAIIWVHDVNASSNPPSA